MDESIRDLTEYNVINTYRFTLYIKILWFMLQKFYKKKIIKWGDCKKE